MAELYGKEKPQSDFTGYNSPQRKYHSPKKLSLKSPRLSTDIESLGESLASLGLQDSPSSSVSLGSSISSMFIEDVVKKSPEVKKTVPQTPTSYQDQYKTRYVTINPNERRIPRYAPLELPTLKPEDSSWLFQPDGSPESLSLSQRIGKDIKIGDKLKKKLIKDGYLDTDTESVVAQDSKKEGKKQTKAGKKKSKGSSKSKKKQTEGGADSLLGDRKVDSDMEDLEGVEGGEKLAEASKELHALLKLNPEKRKSKRKFSDSEVCRLIEAFPALAKKTFGFRFFEGQRSRHVYALSMLCALGASKGTIKKCYMAFPDAMEVLDDGLGNPLHYACTYRAKRNVIAFLSQKSPRSLLQVDEEDHTPLHVALVSDNSLEVITTLVESGRDALLMENEDGYTPLHVACMEDTDYEVVKLLAGKFPETVLSKSHSGATPLHLAIFYDASLEIVECLVKANEKAIQEKDGKGRLPLHVAASVEAPIDVMQYLVSMYPEARSCKSKSGKTPHTVARKADTSDEVLELLMVA